MFDLSEIFHEHILHRYSSLENKGKIIYDGHVIEFDFIHDICDITIDYRISYTIQFGVKKIYRGNIEVSLNDIDSEIRY